LSNKDDFWNVGSTTAQKQPAQKKDDFWDVGSTAPGGIVQETHPEVTWSERATIKNFGTDPAQSIAFLQQKHPGMQFQMQGDQITMKNPQEKDWKVLDPEGFDIADISDIAYDIPAGLATSAATVAGGLAGGLPGGVAAGMGSSGAAETLRQAIGRGLGVNQEFSGKDIGIAAGVGAAAPLLLGTGATAAQMAARAAAKNVPLETLKASQQGVISRAMPSVVEAVSGVPKQTYATMREEIGNILGMQKIGAGEARTKFAEEASGKLKRLLGNYGEKLKTRFGQALDETGARISIDDALQPVRDRLVMLEDDYARVGTDTIKKEIATLRDFLSKQTPRISGVVDDYGNLVNAPVSEMNASDATKYLRGLRTKLESMGVLDNKAGGLSLERVKEKDKLASSTMLDVYHNLSGQLDNAVAQSDPSVRADYAMFKNIERTWLPNVKTPEKTEKFLKNLLRSEKKILSESVQNQAKIMGGDVGKELEKMAAYGMYLEPGHAPLSAKGATSTSRTMAIVPTLGSIGYSAAEAMGSKNPFIWSNLTAAGSNLLVSPAAQLAAQRAKQAVRNKFEQGLRYAPGIGNISPWQMMGQSWQNQGGE